MQAVVSKGEGGGRACLLACCCIAWTALRKEESSLDFSFFPLDPSPIRRRCRPTPTNAAARGGAEVGNTHHSGQASCRTWKFTFYAGIKSEISNGASHGKCFCPPFHDEPIRGEESCTLDIGLHRHLQDKNEKGSIYHFRVATVFIM